MDTRSIYKKENEQLKKLHDIVQQAIDEEQLIMNNLMHPPKEMLTTGQQVSDKMARFGGSWKFIIFFMILLMVWIVYNALAPTGRQFDPYPFILMNLVLSCIAALQAPIIMMSQNRQEDKDRMRAENDYMINMKAELEVRSLHRKIDLLLEEQIKTLFEVQQKQMNMLDAIEKKLKKPGTE